MSKIKNYPDLSSADPNLNWYTAMYLGLPDIFLAVIRKRVDNNSIIDQVIIPTHSVQDPVSGSNINTYPMDRYFFVGSKKSVQSESELGFKSSLTTTTLIRTSSGSPIKLKLSEIESMINHHKNQKRKILQDMVDVIITRGTFKDWYGTVIESAEDETVRVTITSDNYNFDVDMPIAICKPLTYTT